MEVTNQHRVEKIYENEDAGVERSRESRPHSCPLKYDTPRTMQLKITEAIDTDTENCSFKRINSKSKFLSHLYF